MMVRFRTAVVAALTALVAAAPLAAQSGYFSSDNLGYTGTVTCYGSLANALDHMNPTCNSSMPQRDLALYFVDNNAAFADGYPASAAMFLTNWWASPAGNGVGNPNNNNVGFMQMYDTDAGSVSSMAMGWDPSLTVFQLAASGGPTITGCTSYPPQDCGRLWNGATSANGGSFISWNVNAMFSGFTQAVYNAVTGVYESQSEPTAVTGTINGLFADATTGQFYELNASINMNSWAVQNGYAGMTVAGGPITATPEPASLALFATGIAGLGGFSIKRRRKQQQVAAV